MAYVAAAFALILMIDAAQQTPPGRNHHIAMARALQTGPNRVVDDAALQSLIAKHAGDPSYQIAEAHTLRRDPDNMFKLLDQAWANRDSVIPYLTYDSRSWITSTTRASRHSARRSDHRCEGVAVRAMLSFVAELTCHRWLIWAVGAARRLGTPHILNVGFAAVILNKSTGSFGWRIQLIDATHCR